MASNPAALITPGSPRASEEARGVGWVIQWALVTAAASFVSTGVDSILLHYRESYFTGGFLARDYITHPAQAVAFFVGSLFSDAAAIGIIVGVVLWIAGRLAIRRNLAFIAALVCAWAPIAGADFIAYQLARYFGDAFDIALMFDLTGRSPEEILAVASGHTTRLALLGGGCVLVLISGFWLMRRHLLSRGQVFQPVSLRRALVFPAALLAIGAATVTTMRTSSDVLDNGLRRKPTARILGAGVEALTDLDRDGFGILGRPADPDLFDGRIKPYALDIPGNGIDEDGIGGDLPLDVPRYGERNEPALAWRSTPDIVLIVLESFRADAFGATFDDKPVTPVLDALASHGISVKHAYSHNGYTVQSRRHIFTGSTADIRGDRTLIDDFKGQGYQTAYFSAQDESFGGPAQGVGFERADVAYDARADRRRRFTEFSTPGSLAVPFNVLVERVDAFLNKRRADRPLFLYVNFEDTHFPYHHSGIQPVLNTTVLPEADIGPQHEDAVRAMYLNTAANVDRAIGDVLATARRSLGHDPGVIVLADHGESLFDEGFLGHGYALNDAQTRIPVIVANLPLTIQEPFGQADLRDAINAALAMPPVQNPTPTLRENSSRTVFQYLGLINRPVQIALTAMNGRVVYDFRERKVRIGDGQWRRPEDLDATERAAFLDVVRTWERMMLARSAASDVGS